MDVVEISVLLNRYFLIVSASHKWDGWVKWKEKKIVANTLSFGGSGREGFFPKIFRRFFVGWVCGSGVRSNLIRTTRMLFTTHPVWKKWQKALISSYWLHWEGLVVGKTCSPVKLQDEFHGQVSDVTIWTAFVILLKFYSSYSSSVCLLCFFSDLLWIFYCISNL